MMSAWIEPVVVAETATRGGRSSFISWGGLHAAASLMARDEPLLTCHLEVAVLRHAGMDAALSHLLASKLATRELPMTSMCMLFAVVLAAAPSIVGLAWSDLCAVVERDPAVDDPTHPWVAACSSTTRPAS